MDQLSLKISQALGLNETLSQLDFLIIFAIFALIIITFVNLLSTDTSKDEAPELPEVAKVFVSEESSVEQSSEVIVEEVVPQQISEPVVETISWDKRLFKGLSRTRSEVWGRVTSILSGSRLDDAMVEELEEILFTSDLSPALVDELLDELKRLNSEENTQSHLSHIKAFLKSKMEAPQNTVNTELYEFKKSETGPKVIMIVGVNGAGKTTTIGKLATKLKSQGASVVVGACDTFRAAAVEQLEVWCNRAGVEIVKSAEGADPSGVAFDAVKKAKEINADYCIIDTAGRLHTKSNLMDELAKTKKVMSKVIPEAPHETLLVLDAITGQNALRQAEEFNKLLNLTGLIFTKCDGSSKAGSAVSIVQSLSVPIVYIGVGEDVEDLDIFNLDSFLNALLGLEA
jgi:fused signal recognition particle receptor